MAGEINGTVAMETTSHIPIAQLTPLLSAPGTRSIKAIVTLTWPYSSAIGSIAFLLSEPDFRLRRTRGQVRVQFAGSSAKNVAKAGIASGDEVTLCLDGVEWIEGQSDAATPGRGVEFELKFTEKLYLQFKQQDASEVSTISIDHPAPEPEAALSFARIPTPEPSPTIPDANGATPHPSIPLLAADEWWSPAFLKRARTSYGSLFDSDYDPFSEEDGTVVGRGRKKTRLSSTWRYSSRSPTPEQEEDRMMEQAIIEPASKPTPPAMADEACQTVGLEVGVAAETLAGFTRQATNIGSTSYTQSNGVQLPDAGDFNGVVEDAEPVVIQLPMPPPRIQTQRPDLRPDEVPDFDHEAPSSPRLHPIPSDSLPLVSPLVSHSYGINVGQPRQATPDPPLNNQLSVPNGIATADEEEDIYGASPVGRRADVSSHGFNGFQAPAGSQGVEFPAVGGYAIEDQYGHWQNANAQLSRSASPQKPEGFYHEEPQLDEPYDDQEQDQYKHGLPNVHHSNSRYPEIDTEISDDVQHPRIPEENGAFDNQNASYPLPPHPSGLSRSQSAQSPVVDLTEDSDEQNESQVENEDSLMESDAEEEFEEDEIVEEYSHRESQLRQAGRDHHMEQDHNSSDGSDADADGSQDEEEENVYYFEDEADGEEELEPGTRHQQTLEADDGEDYEDDGEEDLEQNSRYQRTLEYDDDQEQGSYDEEEEEEGSYDEDDKEAEPEPAPKRAAVVIDLLSSDDEDAADTTPSGRQSAPPQVQQTPAESDRESEQSESEEGEDGEDGEIAVPYNERTEIRTRGPIEYNIRPDMPIYEQDDEELLDEQDDMTHDGIDARNTEMSQNRAASLDENSEDESEGDEDSEPGVELMEEDSREVDDEPRTPEHKGTSINKSADSPQPPSSAGLIEQRGLSSGIPSLFARMFNLDGANDSPSPPASVVGEDLNSQELAEKTVQHNATQMPTPDDTQLSYKVASAESSFSSTDIRQTEGKVDDNQNVAALEVIAKVEVTSEEVMINTASDNVQIPPASMENKAAEAGQTLEVDDVVMTEEVFETNEVVESTVTTEMEDTPTIEAAFEEIADEEENTEVDGFAQDNESIISEAESEISVGSAVDEPVQNVETITGEATEMDEDDMTVTNSSAEGVIEDAEETESTDQTVPVISESAFEYLAKVIEAESDESVVEKTVPEPVQDHNTHVEVVVEEPAPEPIQEHNTHVEVVIQEPVPEPFQKQNTHVEVVVEEPEFTVDHPRRSHRRVNEALANPAGASQKVDETRETISEEEGHDTVQEYDEVMAEHLRRSHRKVNEDPTEPASVGVKDDEADESVPKATGPEVVPEHTEEVTEGPTFTAEHPRRSHRRAKSTTSTSKTEEEPRLVTPAKSRTVIEPVPEASEETSPMVVIDAPSTPRGHDASMELALAQTPKGHDASIELALSSLESPSKQAHDLRNPPVVDLKLRLSRALRTELSEFTALKVIRYHLTQKLDILAVATTTPPEPTRAKGGPRQYQITFNVTDPSIAPSGVTEVQVFRPYSNALPIIEAGDGILLRNFQVTSVKKGFALRSTQDEGSSWAVFKDASSEPDIRGPPVEFGDGEKNHIIAMKAWYRTLDDVAKAKISRANEDKAAARR